MKPVYELKDGKFHISFGGGLDLDKDQKDSVGAVVTVVLDPAELVSEIAKKDMPMIEMLLKSLGEKKL